MRPSALPAALGITVGVLVVLTSLAVPLFQGQVAAFWPAGPPVALAPAPQSARPLNATDCGLLSATYIQGSVSGIGWPPGYATETEIMYAKLCNDSAFVSLLAKWGGWHWMPPVTSNGTTTPGYLVSLNFTLEFGQSGPPSAWGNWSDFVVEWVSWNAVPANVSSPGTCPPCIWVEFWAGSLPGTNYSRPNLTVYELSSGGGPPTSRSPGPVSPASSFQDAWFVGLIAGVDLVVAVTALVAFRRRVTPPPQMPGRLP
jgi:hypothetical protein